MIDAIYPIVEGHGEVRAVPILLRRLAQKYGAYTTQIFRPYRVPRGRMFAGSHLENAVELACRKLEQVTGIGAVLVLLDADSDCPAEIAPDLLRRVRALQRISESIGRWERWGFSRAGISYILYV